MEEGMDIQWTERGSHTQFKTEKHLYVLNVIDRDWELEVRALENTQKSLVGARGASLSHEEAKDMALFMATKLREKID